MRRLIRVLMYAIGGGLITLLTCWTFSLVVPAYGMATWIDTDKMVRVIEPSFYQIGYQSRSKVSARVISTSIQRAIGYPKPDTKVLQIEFQRSFPTWSVAADIQAETDNRGRSDLEHAFGWPFLAMSVHRLTGQFSGGGGYSGGGGGGGGCGSAMELERGIEIPSRLTPWIHIGPQVAQTLPTRILTVGFAANALFYGVFLFLMVSTRRFGRGRLRRCRGQCEICAYDLRGGGHERCPECGVLVDSAG